MAKSVTITYQFEGEPAEVFSDSTIIITGINPVPENSPTPKWLRTKTSYTMRTVTDAFTTGAFKGFYTWDGEAQLEEELKANTEAEEWKIKFFQPE
jgi:hypothetical protein